MARKRSYTPKFRHHKPTNQGFIELDGHRQYLGRYDLPETKERYHRLVAELLAGGGHEPVPTDELTIDELVARYWEFAIPYYRTPDGGETGEVGQLRRCMKIVSRLYGSIPASQFGPLALKAARKVMIDRRQARKDINRQVGRIRRVFRWGVQEELIGPDVLQALEALTPLKRGRCDAKETEPIHPVPDEFVTAILPFVSKPVAALVQLQRLTAARGGELLIMRPCDLNTTADVWLYAPSTHKNAYRGHGRTIAIGPKAQEILRPFLAGRAVDAYMFDPREAVAEMKTRGAKSKRRPDQKPNPKKTDRCVRDHYDKNSYRKAVVRGCKLADVPAWHPHQLRHSAATVIRRDFGLDGAQAALGNRSAQVAEVYAELSTQKAVEIARKIG